jgi:RNA polymerase sigma-54 factor
MLIGNHDYHYFPEIGDSSTSGYQTRMAMVIKQLIGAEDKKNPFSDSKITDMLAEQGMVVARRTVAKYREALKIPPVNLRKSL